MEEDNDPKASSEEVIEAYEKLTDHELYRLKVLARQRNYAPVPGYTAEDLMNDVLISFLSLERKWPKERISFFICFWYGIKNHSSNRARHLKSGEGDIEFKLLRHEPGENNEIDEYIEKTDGNREVRIDARLTIEKIRENFSDDSKVIELLECISEGFSGPEIKELLSWNQTEMETVQRRLNRGILKIKKELGYE